MPTGGLIAGIGDFGVEALLTQAEQAESNAESSAGIATTKAGEALASANSASVSASQASQSAMDAVVNDKPFVKAGEVILKGQPVYISNANGANSIISLASNATEVKSSNVYGLALQNFAVNDILQVVRRGELTGLDTSTATIGDSVWLGANGQKLYGITNKPLGTHLVYLGIVKRVHQNQGVIDVDIKNGFEVEELHNVTLTSLQETDLFGYIGGRWQNVPRYFRIAKYTAESQLPTVGNVGTVYFLNVAGSKYLKYWNSTTYANASTKTDLPKCISSIQRDYYAKFSDISTANYGNRVAEIQVIEDETKSNLPSLYYFDGNSLRSFFNAVNQNIAFPFILPLTLS